MDPAGVFTVASAAEVFDAGGADMAAMVAMVDEIRCAEGWFESRRLRIVSEMNRRAASDAAVFPEGSLSGSGKQSPRQAGRDVKRAKTLDAVPELKEQLAAGACSGEHLDALANVGERLEPGVREQLLADPELSSLAARLSPDQFRREVTRRAMRLNTGDGTERLARQRKLNFLRSWNDPVTGMVHIKAEFDPETGGLLVGRIRNQVEKMFHTDVPDDCPSGDAKQGYLQAMALDALTKGEGSGAGRVEMSIVVDLDTLLRGLHDKSYVDTSGFDLPIDTIRRMACIADIIPTVLNSDGVVVDLGRTTRLASAAQRRALRAMYPTCAVHGCRTGFDRCQPHHIHWWEHGGPTDMLNLVPLCVRHHHLVHEGHWQIELDPTTRWLTVTLPDGTVHTTGPPTARAG